MYSVVGLTLDDVCSGRAPHVRLAEVLKDREKKGKALLGWTKPVLVYTTDSNDTQGLVARTRYKDRGSFLVFLYFSDGAVDLCNEAGIALRVLDHVDERGLPARKVKVLEHPSIISTVKK